MDTEPVAPSDVTPRTGPWGSGGPIRPEQSRSVERQGQVLSAAVGLLLSKGSAAVTHRRVAAESNSSPGAVRYYFGSREDLLAACLVEFERVREGEAERILAGLGDASPSARGLASMLLGIYYGPDLDDATATGVVWSVVDCARESPRLATRLGGYREAAHRQLGDLLTRCGRADVNPSLVTALLDGSILSTTVEGKPGAAETAIAELAEFLRIT